MKLSTLENGKSALSRSYKSAKISSNSVGGTLIAIFAVKDGFDEYKRCQEYVDSGQMDIDERNINVGTEVVLSATGGVLSMIISSAVVGAVVGSFAPGVGTVIGFVVGLAVGIIWNWLLDKVIIDGKSIKEWIKYGIYDMWENITNSKECICA